MQNARERFFSIPDNVSTAVREAWHGLHLMPEQSHRMALTAYGSRRGKPGDQLWTALLLSLHAVREGAPRKADPLLAAAASEPAQSPRTSLLLELVKSAVALGQSAPDTAITTASAVEAQWTAQATKVAGFDRFLCQHTLALANNRVGHLERVLQYHYANQAHVDRAGLPDFRAIVALNLSGALISIDEAESALYHGRLAMENAEQTQNAALIRRARINVALGLRFCNQFDEAITITRGLLEAPDADPVSRFSLYINAAELFIAANNADEAERLLQIAGATTGGEPTQHQSAHLEWTRGFLESQRGNHAAAVAAFERASRHAQGLKNLVLPFLPRMVRQLAESYAALGDFAKAFETHRVFHELYEARLGYTARARFFALRGRDELARVTRALEEARENNHRMVNEQQELAALNQRLIERVRQVEQLSLRLRDAAERDPLTGLFNRGALDRELGLRFRPGNRRGQTGAVVLLDLDHFKTVNDRFGHPAGDAVLKTVARLLGDQLRGGDFAARYGGEEFCLLLAGVSLSQAKTKIDTLRRAFANMAFDELPEGERLTFSAGIAAYPTDGRDAAHLLLVADQRLRAAKASGRNRVRAS